MFLSDPLVFCPFSAPVDTYVKSVLQSFSQALAKCRKISPILQHGLERGEAKSSRDCVRCPGAPRGANKSLRHPNCMQCSHLWG